MAKDPVFPLYYNDIDRSTKTWTDEEFGAYVRLLMEQWDKGELPKDYQRLTRIATSLDRTWPLLKAKFVEAGDGLQNLVLEEIREKRNRFKEKQKDNVLKRYQKSTKPPTKNIPLEVENEIEIEDKLKGAFDENYLEQVKMNWRHIDFDFEFRTFCDKVRGSPEHYAAHDTGGIRLALQSQLRNSKSQNGAKQKNTDVEDLRNRVKNL